MNLLKIKEKRLRKKLDKTISKFQENRVVSQKKIFTVGILTSEHISSVIDLQSRIEPILGVKNSKMFTFTKSQKTGEISNTTFTKKDMNWYGNFTAPSFKDFLEQPFDLLIGYFNEENLYLEMAVLQSKATFKAGFSKVNSQLYEIEISEKIGNTRPFTNELKRYLQILKKL